MIQEVAVGLVHLLVDMMVDLVVPDNREVVMLGVEVEVEAVLLRPLLR